MWRAVVDARAVVTMAIAPGVGAWGLHVHLLRTDDVFLAVIALRSPHLFDGLAYAYATLCLRRPSCWRRC
jgi:uncharacterized protein (DUF934 family)